RDIRQYVDRCGPERIVRFDRRRVGESDKMIREQRSREDRCDGTAHYGTRKAARRTESRIHGSEHLAVQSTHGSSCVLTNATSWQCTEGLDCPLEALGEHHVRRPTERALGHAAIQDAAPLLPRLGGAMAAFTGAA